jgi:hypothetical protein
MHFCTDSGAIPPTIPPHGFGYLLDEHRPQQSTELAGMEEHEAEVKRLKELAVDVARLNNEKGDLLRQNVTCRTDIKKLKER